MEIIPKEKEQQNVTLGSLLYYVGLALLGVAILSSVAFLFLTKKTINEKNEIVLAFEASETEEFRNKEREIMSLNRKVFDFLNVVESKKSAFYFLGLIEENIHPGIHFTRIEILPHESVVYANGVAQTTESIDQQLKIFKNVFGESLVSLRDIETHGSLWKFRLIVDKNQK